jgi:hypothetical protein
MVILSFLALALLLGVANPLSAPFFHRSTSSLERRLHTRNKHYSDRQRGKHTALSGSATHH